MLLGIAQLCSWWSLIIKADTLVSVDFSAWILTAGNLRSQKGWVGASGATRGRALFSTTISQICDLGNPCGTSGSLAAKASLKRRPKRTMSRGFGTGTRSSFTFRTVSVEMEGGNETGPHVSVDEDAPMHHSCIPLQLTRPSSPANQQFSPLKQPGVMWGVLMTCTKPGITTVETLRCEGFPKLRRAELRVATNPVWLLAAWLLYPGFKDSLATIRTTVRNSTRAGGFQHFIRSPIFRMVGWLTSIVGMTYNHPLENSTPHYSHEPVDSVDFHWGIRNDCIASQ